MANNRMWFVNEKSGKKVMLAKYYPSTGWYIFYEDLLERLDKMFDEEKRVSLFGPTPFVIKYETQEEENAVPVFETTSESEK